MAKKLAGKYIRAAAKKTRKPGPRMKLAWKLQNAAQGKTRKKKTSTKKKASPKKKASTKKKGTTKKKASTKKKTSTKRTTAKKKSNPKSKGRTMKTLVSPKTVKMVMDSGTVAAGLVASTLGMNKIPMIKDWKPWQKILAQAVVGIIGMAAFLKSKWIFLLFSGTFTGAAATALLELVPATMKGRRFTPTEFKQLQEGINAANTMGTPLSYYRNQPKYKTMGTPITTALNMGTSVNAARRTSSG